MIRGVPAVWGRMGRVLVEPRAAIQDALAEPRPWITAVALALPLVALGLATLPRQLSLLDAAFALTGDAQADFTARMMREGLTRLIVADRLVPSPTLLAAAFLTVIVAEPVLMLARERRAQLWSVVLLALTPLVLARIGELALTWLTSYQAGAPPGEIILLPHRFRTGPAIFWNNGTPPSWLERLDGTVNLVTLWTAALWAAALRILDGRTRFALWHVGLPLACLAGGAAVTWLLAPLALALVLGTP